jgi:hypothetical protein
MLKHGLPMSLSAVQTSAGSLLMSGCLAGSERYPSLLPSSLQQDPGPVLVQSPLYMRFYHTVQEKYVFATYQHMPLTPAGSAAGADHGATHNGARAVAVAAAAC